MRTALVASAVLIVTVLLLAGTSAAASRCVVHGREIRNLEHVTCAQAKPIVKHFLETLRSSRPWQCHGYRGQVWSGYCETTDGRRYLTWRTLS